MSGPFNGDREQRAEWWNERLWLQATLIFFFVLAVAVTFYGLSVVAVAGTVAFTVLCCGFGWFLYERKRSV